MGRAKIFSKSRRVFNEFFSERATTRNLCRRIIGFGLTLFVVFFMSPTLSSAQTTGSAAALTEKEKAWIKEHPVVRLMPDPLFPPFEYFDDDGNFQGIGADFIALLEKKLGLKFDIIRVKDWKESVARTVKKENDVWSVVTNTPERAEYMLFTKPYIESPSIIVVRSDVQRELKEEDLKGLKVVVSSGYAVHEILKKRHPKMAFDAVPDPMSGLKKVSLGMADAMVINIALASHMMEKAGISNLRMAGEVDFTYRWGFASRKDWPELHAILEKGLAQITKEERQAITRKWVALQNQPFVITKTMVMWAVAVLALLGVSGVLIWNRSLKMQVRLRTEEVEAELAERKAAELALQNSERILSTAVGSISDGFVLLDADDRIVLTNSRFRNLYPNSHDLIQKGAKFEDFLRGGAERGEFVEAAGQIDEWVAKRMAETSKNVATIEDHLIGDRWVRAGSQRLPDGGRVSIHVDLTEIRQAQKDVQDKAELIQLLRSTADNANEAESLNEAMRNVLNDIYAYNHWPVGHVYARSEEDDNLFVSTDIWHLESPERYETFREITEKTKFELGVGLPGRVAASGKPLWVRDISKDTNFPRAKLAVDLGVKSGFGCPVLIGTEVIAVLEFFAPEIVEPDQSLLDTLVQVGMQLGRVAERERTDLELRRRQAELEYLNDQKNKFFSIIAHDLKGPFTSLLGASDLMVNLSESASRSQLAELAQSVSRGGKRVFALLENLLEWSRIQMDKVEIEPAVLDLQSLVQDSVDVLNPIAVEKGLQIVNEVGDVEIFADRQNVETVIRNLVNNAIKFTKKSGTITVNAMPDGNWAEVTVSDTGIGMPQDKVDKLFNLGEKSSTIGTDGETGTGLGLHLCKELVEEHGGAIHVKSTEGEGTNICFTLPKPS